MKTMSKILSIVLVLAMVMSFALVAHAEDVTATLSFADVANRTVFNAEQQVWEANGVKVTNNKAGSRNDVADYSNPARFYAGSDLTIEYPGMSKIVVDGISGRVAGWTETANADANATISVDGTVVTIEFATPADSFTLAGLSGQLRVNELTVYTASSEGGEDVPETTKYYVAGQDALCGSNWIPGDEANMMTAGEDGLYTKVYENVAAGTYELKVTIGDWTESWGDPTSSNGNYFATVEALSTVTVIFNPETKAITIECVPVPVLTVVDIATALAGADGEEFMVQGVVVCIESGKNVYIQDATGAICVRTSDTPADLTLGFTITATGTRGNYNGLPQLNNATYEADYTAQELSPKETTIGALTTADICTYVKLSGLTVTEVYDNNGAYTTPNITVTDGTDEIQIYKAIVDKNEDGSWAIKVGDTIDVCAAIGYFNKFQLRNTLADEITVVVDETPENPGEGGEVNPGTGDMAIAGLALAMMAATAGIVVLKKKEF